MATSATSQEQTGSQFDRDKIMAELDVKGYSVIPNVLTEAECDVNVASYRDWLGKFGEGNQPFWHNSLIQSFRIGHFQPTWKTRLSAKKVFEMVWQTKKLLTSFDAVAIAAPPEGRKDFATPGSTWLHLDQAAKRQGLHCYQGAVYLEESSDTDYCFRVLEGSHNHTDDFFKEDPWATARSNKREFFKLYERSQWYEKRGCRLTKVPVPKGGLVLWDSRLVHDNCRPEYERPNSERWRFVVFVCMTPARWSSPKELDKKREAYKKLVMTTHWPSQGVSFFSERPTDSDSGVPLLSKLPGVARSQEARLLAGVDEYDFEDGEPNGPAWDPVWVQE